MQDNKQDIVKANALIEAIYNPGSVYQIRLFLAALLKIKAKQKLTNETIHSVTAVELAELTGTKRADNHRELQRAAKQLCDTSVYMRHDYDGEPLEEGDWLQANLVSSCRYKHKEGRVELRFTAEILPYISSISRRFTRYKARNVMPMRSSYGIRLYELCLQWLDEQREFSVTEFRALFELEKKYKPLAELKRNVIEPALKDINTHSDIRVSFSQRKAGRVVTHFVFTITKPSAQENSIEVLAFEPWVNRFGLAKNKGYQNWAEARKALGKSYRAYCKDPLSWVKKHGSDTDYRELLEAQGQARLAFDS